MPTFKLNTKTVDTDNLTVTADRGVAKNKGAKQERLVVCIEFAELLGGQVEGVDPYGLARLLAMADASYWITKQNVIRAKGAPRGDTDGVIYLDASKGTTRTRKSTGDKLRALVAKKHSIPVGDVTTEMILAELDS